MVDVITKYNPRVLDVSPYYLWAVERELHRKSARGGTHYTLSLEGLSKLDRRHLREWASRAGGRLSTAVNGGPCSALLSISEGALRRFTSNLHKPRVDLEGVLGAVEETISGYQRESFCLSHSKGSLRLGKKTCVMGILNVTPDSFYDGGRYCEPGNALARAHQMIEEGAGIIDIGGVSTRPGSLSVSQEEELRRIIPVIKELSSQTEVPISVDTYRAKVAEKALEAGAQIINDISGLSDKDMARVAASTGAPVVIMHLKGSPHRMPKNPTYKNLLAEITQFLRRKVCEAVSAGVNESSIIIDPGIGFGKSPRQSLEVLCRLGELRSLGLPVMVGTSHKSFTRDVLGPLDGNKTLEIGDVLSGTLATVALAIEKGAKIVRVHEVREAVRVAAVCDAVVRDRKWKGPSKT
ncbi:MAG: dihydropteroate synthase [Candidatus Brocadiales bacterium]